VSATPAPLPPYAAVVLAGGRAARLGGRAKPQLVVGGRTMLATVLDAVADASPRVVVGPPQPVADGVVVVRERPPGGGPVAAMRAGLAAVAAAVATATATATATDDADADADADVVAVLAGDLPFVTAALVHDLRERLTGDGVLVVDSAGRDQYLLGVWRTAALRAALAGADGPVPVRRVVDRLTVTRYRPPGVPGTPPPWTDCDTPADLDRARAAAGEPGRG
jgi:molybdenum cofactor guanylyltransferase